MNLTPELIASLVKSKEGQIFFSVIKEELKKLDSIGEMQIDFGNPEAIAVETLARKRAGEILRDILKPFNLFQEPAEKEEGKELY